MSETPVTTEVGLMERHETKKAEYYETRQELLRRIHEMRDLIVKSNPPAKTKGHLNEIFKAIRDGSKSTDPQYNFICFSIILDHIIALNNKLNLAEDDKRLESSMKMLQEAFEIGETDTS